MVQTTDDPIEKRSRSELAGEALKVLAAFEVVGVGVPALLPDALPVVLPDVLPDCELVAEPCDTGDENSVEEDADVETLGLVGVDWEEVIEAVLGTDEAEVEREEELIPTEVVVTETLAALEVEARLIPFPILDRVVQEDDEGIGWADGVTGSP